MGELRKSQPEQKHTFGALRQGKRNQKHTFGRSRWGKLAPFGYFGHSRHYATREDAQLQIRKNQHTESLTALDEKHDRLYRGLVLRVQSEELSPNEERRAAAAKVLLVVDTYGNFTSHNYQKETTEITNFLADLQSAELSTLIAKTDASVSQWKNILAQRKGKKFSPSPSKGGELKSE